MEIRAYLVLMDLRAKTHNGRVNENKCLRKISSLQSEVSRTRCFAGSVGLQDRNRGVGRLQVKKRQSEFASSSSLSVPPQMGACY